MRKVASIAVKHGQSYLWLRRRDNGKWTLPGGHFEGDEQPLEAAKRELWEETGIKADKLEPLGVGTVGDKLEIHSFLYRPKTVPKVSFENDPDKEATESLWFKDDLPEEPSVPHGRNVTLILLKETANGGDVKIQDELSKMAISDLEPGKPQSDGTHLYNHLLPSQWQGKLDLVVDPGQDMVHTFLRDKEDPDENHVGSIQAFLNGDGTMEPHSDLMEEYHGHGLGKAMYEALYSHALNRLGVHTVEGGMHSEDAGRVHEALARKHGLGYKKTPRPDSPAMSDMTRGPYRYSLTKGLGTALAVGGMMALGQMSPKLKAGFDKVNPPAQTEVAPAQSFQATVDKAPKWTPEGLHNYLIPIAHLESSFGQNMNHAPHAKGEYHTAVGAVGFKPSTAHEEWGKSKKLKELYPGLEDPATFMAKFKTDHKLYNLLASSHFLRLVQRHGTPEKAAYAWRWGSTAAAGASQDAIDSSPYVMRYRDLAASTGVKKSETLEKMAIKDIRPGKEVQSGGDWGFLTSPGSTAHDYSHVLPKAARKDYKLFVLYNPTTKTAVARTYNLGEVSAWHDGGRVGIAKPSSIVTAGLNRRAIETNFAQTEGPHQGKGLGAASYEALFAHLFHHHGARQVVGDTHSSLAARTHQKLSDKHDLDYPYKERNTENGRPFDDRFGPYEYDLA